MADANDMSFNAPMLGQVLLRSGKITVQDLDAALAMQAVTGERLGEALVGSGVISEDDLAQALDYLRRYCGREA